MWDERALYSPICKIPRASVSLALPGPVWHSLDGGGTDE